MSRLPSLGIGIGAPGLRDTKPSCRTRPDKCAEYGHPFVTYNPIHDVCCCLCGARWGEGNGIKWPKADGHDGPLHTCDVPAHVPRGQEYEWLVGRR